MSITRCRYFAILILCIVLHMVPFSQAATLETAKPTQPLPPPHVPSSKTYPQIVRISYLEGDVRISRGKVGEEVTGSAWEAAVANLPLETGFSLVTGTGRAEIEFEDASTVYLGENSVLALKDLHTTGGVPHTELALLTGTATLNLHPNLPTETYILETPTDRLFVLYPRMNYLRVNSYLDAMAVTPQKFSAVLLPGEMDKRLTTGQTAVFSAGHTIAAPESYNSAEFAEWDKWVADRVAARSAAMAAAMKDAGLKFPVPGLADLNGKGTFFACPPYGTCWEPTASQGQQQPTTPSHDSQQVSAPSGQQPTPIRILERLDFPCGPDLLTLIEKDPVSGKEKVIDSKYVPAGYDWAVCHAGSWIYRRHHYVWVVGHRKHHHRPHHWVKDGRFVAYVPTHPRDVAGKPPINRKHDVFTVRDRKSGLVERVSLNPNHKVEILSSPPKEFRKPYYAPLSAAAGPRAEVHRLGETLASSKGSASKNGGSWLTFDHKSRNFMLNEQVMKGSKSTSVHEPFKGSSGSLQARAGGVGSHGQYIVRSSGGTGGNSAGRSSSSSNRGGGGSRASGGYSGGSHGGSSGGGGGGSHGGGGGGGGSHAGGGSGGGGGGGGGGGVHR